MPKRLWSHRAVARVGFSGTGDAGGVRGAGGGCLGAVVVPSVIHLSSDMLDREKSCVSLQTQV